MRPQRYVRVANADTEENSSTLTRQDDDDDHGHDTIPSSPPPSFHSLTPPRRSSAQHSTIETEVERSLDDAFGGPHDSDDETDESRRLVTRAQSVAGSEARPSIPRRMTQFPAGIPSGRVYGAGSGTRDGVFSNVSAKPIVGEEVEEKPPTYEQAAADAAPPYWETTIYTPAGYSSDDIFIDGLVVGSIFSFIWNALISMSFQLIGFLLTYLLHTTHAAKQGSRAGLGVTLIQYGFAMRNVLPMRPSSPGGEVGGGVPDDADEHNFDPNKVGAGSSRHGPSLGDWFGYALMIVGWFLLIHASSSFVRARRQERLIRVSPDRGLPVPVIAEGEGEHAV